MQSERLSLDKKNAYMINDQDNREFSWMPALKKMKIKADQKLGDIEPDHSPPRVQR